MSVDAQSVNDLIARVVEIDDKRIRRRGLERSGRAIVKLQKAEMKRRAKTRKITGALEKSIDGKTIVNKARTRVVTIVGPSKGKVKKGERFKLSFAVTRRSRGQETAVLNRRGEQLYRQPTRYAHLAGPRRKSTFVQETVIDTAVAVRTRIVEALTEALEGQ